MTAQEYVELLLQPGLYLLATWFLWRLTKLFNNSSPLDNVPGPPSTGNWLAGHAAKLFNVASWEFHRDVCDKYGQVVKMDGPFGTHWLLVFDPVALHSMFVKDKPSFDETEIWFASNELMFGKGLLATSGEQHRKQRKLLNPMFSNSHMCHLLPIFYQITDRLRHAIAARAADGPQTLDILEWATRTGLDIAGQAGLGYSIDSLTEDTHNAYGDAIKSCSTSLFVLQAILPAIPFLSKVGPARFRRWVVEHVPSKRVQRVREIADTMDSVAREIFDARKVALEKDENAAREGKDIISHLLRANMVSSDEEKLSDEEIIAQMSSIMFAATDTTSGHLAHILQVLADHPSVQERLRREIVNARSAVNSEHLPYDELLRLPYLDAVCRESLRLYPPLLYNFQNVLKDTVIPLGTPILGRDGTTMHEVPVPQGTYVIVDILSSNRNPALWGPDADVWKPERWLGPLPTALTDAPVPGVYSHMMTFFGGPRSCIGFKFAQMEIKAVLATLLPDFTFSPAPELELAGPIVWNMASLQFPSVGYGSKAELPLQVGLVKRSS